jgi:hypothetical protein
MTFGVSPTKQHFRAESHVVVVFWFKKRITIKLFNKRSIGKNIVYGRRKLSYFSKWQCSTARKVHQRLSVFLVMCLQYFFFKIFEFISRPKCLIQAKTAISGKLNYFTAHCTLLRKNKIYILLSIVTLYCIASCFTVTVST